MLRSVNDKRNTVMSTAKLSSFLAIINLSSTHSYLLLDMCKKNGS